MADVPSPPRDRAATPPLDRREGRRALEQAPAMRESSRCDRRSLESRRGQDRDAGTTAVTRSTSAPSGSCSPNSDHRSPSPRPTVHRRDAFNAHRPRPSGRPGPDRGCRSWLARRLWSSGAGVRDLRLELARRHAGSVAPRLRRARHPAGLGAGLHRRAAGEAIPSTRIAFSPRPSFSRPSVEEMSWPHSSFTRSIR